MDLERRAIAGVLSLLLCCGTVWREREKERVSPVSDDEHHVTLHCVSLLCEFVSLTFLSDPVLYIRVPGNHDNLDHEAVAALPDHIDHLPVSHLNHILTIHLEKERNNIQKDTERP